MATARPRTRGGNRPGSKGTRGFDRSRAKAWKYKKKAKKETEDEPTTTVADKPAPEPPASKPDKAEPKENVTATSNKTGGTDTRGFGDMPVSKENLVSLPVITTSPLATKKMETETPSTRPVEEDVPSIPTSDTAPTSPVIEINTFEADTGDEPPASGGEILSDELSASANPDLAEDINLETGGLSVAEITRMLKGIMDPTAEQYDPDNIGEKLGSNENLREFFEDIDPNVTIADSHPKSDTPHTDETLKRIADAEAKIKQAAADEEYLKSLDDVTPLTEEEISNYKKAQAESTGSGGGSGRGSEGPRSYIAGVTEDGDPYYIDENGEPQLAPQWFIDSLGSLSDLNAVERQILAEIKAGKRKGPRRN